MKPFSMEEVKQLRDLNVDLLETTTLIATSLLKYAKEHDLPLPNEDGLMNLLGRASKLIREINIEGNQESLNRIRRKVTEDKSDEDVTASKNETIINDKTECFP